MSARPPAFAALMPPLAPTRGATLTLSPSRRAAPRASLPAQPGVTYLVGAGPGGVDHLTHRAARLISTADVIVTDALADSDVLALHRRDAEVVHVGKRGGSAASVPQAEISELLVQIGTGAVKRSVVRLKAGDPCLFGRASEELAALRAVDCSVEIVPGVTSVSAAAAAVGESLTERSVGRSIVTVSGHDVDALDVELLARCDVVTVLMAGRGLREIVRRIAEADGGGECRRKVSVVRWAGRASTGEERVVQAGIWEIADAVEREMPDGLSPAVVIIARTPPRER
jgi:siroheme synthase